MVSIILGALMALIGSQNSIMLNGYPLFAVCAAIGFLLHWIMFLPAYIYQTEHYFDLTGSISYLTVTIFAIINKPEQDFRAILLCLLIVFWAIRLGSFLLSRVKRDGKDNRFTIMKTKFWWFLMTWTIGGLWVLMTMAAALAAITSDLTLPFGEIAYIGLTLWIIGFSIEIIADKQKTLFRSKIENKDLFISHGLWKWSRHPNYLGEIILWFGIALIAYPVLSDWQLMTLISPIFVYILLTRVSGINILEGRANKKWGNNPEYISYKKLTPVLFPINKLSK
jgi:steroid 5-alpha reductase family enzyme